MCVGPQCAQPGGGGGLFASTLRVVAHPATTVLCEAKSGTPSATRGHGRPDQPNRTADAKDITVLRLANPLTSTNSKPPTPPSPHTCPAVTLVLGSLCPSRSSPPLAQLSSPSFWECGQSHMRAEATWLTLTHCLRIASGQTHAQHGCSVLWWWCRQHKAHFFTY